MPTTQTQAVTELLDFAGTPYEDSDIVDLVREIGNPDALLHIVKTHENVDDYRSAGWQDTSFSEGNITVLRKQIGTHRTARGMKPHWALAHIADCGDHRLVYVER